MTKLFGGHYPPTKKRFFIYLKLFYPMIIGSTLYALNGFIDNFMVGHIEQGGTALSAVNSWTNIMMGCFVGLSAAGSVVNARYYFSGQYEKAQDLFKFRILFGLTLSGILALVSWVSPETLIHVFLKKPQGSNLDLHAYNTAVQAAKDYMRIIAFSWIMIALTSQFGNSLREVGHSKASMYWGIGTIITNVMLNSILMYGVGIGVEGAAYASVAARVVAFSVGIYWLKYKDTKIAFKVWTIFSIQSIVFKDFAKKWYLFVAFAIVTLFITFRNYFYDAGYKAGSDYLGTGVGAMSVLALTGAIKNIFTTTFSAAGAMAANIVGKELAKGNTDKAYVYAKELKGFLTSVAVTLSLILAAFAACLPYMEFLSEAKYNAKGNLTFDNIANLTSVRNSLWVIALYYPVWIWFTVSYRAASTGPKGFWFAFVDFMVSGPVQIGLIAGLAYGVVPYSTFFQNNFWITYFIFFTSDFLKLLFQEILFYKYPWNVKVSKMHQNQIKAEMDDEISGAQIDK